MWIVPDFLCVLFFLHPSIGDLGSRKALSSVDRNTLLDHKEKVSNLFKDEREQPDIEIDCTDSRMVITFRQPTSSWKRIFDNDSGKGSSIKNESS